MERARVSINTEIDFLKKKVVHMHSGILLSCEGNDIMIFASGEWNWKLLR